MAGFPPNWWSSSRRRRRRSPRRSGLPSGHETVAGGGRRMSDSETPESDEAVQPLRRPMMRRKLQGLLRHTDRVVIGIGIVLSGVLTVLGVAHIAWGWLFAAGCAVTAVAALATHGLQARKARDRARSFGSALVISSLIPVVAFGYHEWWDPSRTGPSSYQVIVDGGELDIFYPYDEPGGSQGGYVYAPVRSQGTISLNCYVSLPSSGLWFNIQSTGGWIPRDAVHAIPGTPFPTPPHC